MKRFIPVLAAVVFAVPATASAAPRFQGKAVGNSAHGTTSKHNFFIGDGYSLQFRDNQAANTRYRVCAIMNGRLKRCAIGRTGAAGTWAKRYSGFIYNPRELGRLKWRWQVGGKTVATWTVRIHMGD
jgi:hypothetical protein